MHKETERDSVKRPPDDWHDPMSKDEAWQEATPLKKRIRLELDNDLLRGGGGKEKKTNSQFLRSQKAANEEQKGCRKQRPPSHSRSSSNHLKKGYWYSNIGMSR